LAQTIADNAEAHGPKPIETGFNAGVGHVPGFRFLAGKNKTNALPALFTYLAPGCAHFKPCAICSNSARSGVE
jgi:hypothetical protein